MTWSYTDDYYKQYTRDTWNESAPHYGPVERNLDAWNPPLLQAASPEAGHAVLDVATGLGQPALALAQAVAPGGRVLGIDLSEEMVKLATERAKQAKVDNVRFQVMDAEDLDLEDESQDIVTSRFGIQIVTDPEAALAEMHRVLRPGGRIATTVWASPGEKCPAIDIWIAPMLEFAEPDETGYIPTPYEMGGPGELKALLEATGFRDAQERTVRDTWVFQSVKEFYDSSLKGTPIGHSLLEEDDHVQEVVHAHVKRELPKWTQEDGTVRMTCEGVVVAGTK